MCRSPSPSSSAVRDFNLRGALPAGKKRNSAGCRRTNPDKDFLSGFPEVGDAVDGDKRVVTVDEHPQLEAAGEDELTVVDAGAVNEREVDPTPFQVAQLHTPMLGHPAPPCSLN